MSFRDHLTQEGNDGEEESGVEVPHRLGRQLDQGHRHQDPLQEKFRSVGEVEIPIIVGCEQ